MKMMKAWSNLAVCSTLALTLLTPGVAAAEEMKLPGAQAGTAVMMMNGMELVPLRSAAEALGYRVMWNAMERSVTLIYGGMTNDKMKDGAMPDGTMKDGAMPDKTMPGGTMQDNKMMEDKAMPDKTMSDSMMQDNKMMDDKMMPDKTMPGGMMQDNKMMEDKMMPDKSMSDSMMQDNKMMEDKTMPDKSTPGGTMQDSVMPEKTMSDSTMPDATMSNMAYMVKLTIGSKTVQVGMKEMMASAAPVIMEDTTYVSKELFDMYLASPPMMK